MFPGVEPMFDRDRCVCFGLLFTSDDDDLAVRLFYRTGQSLLQTLQTY